MTGPVSPDKAPRRRQAEGIASGDTLRMVASDEGAIGVERHSPMLRTSCPNRDQWHGEGKSPTGRPPRPQARQVRKGRVEDLSTIPVDNFVDKALYYRVFNQRSQGLLETAWKLGYR